MLDQTLNKTKAYLARPGAFKSLGMSRRGTSNVVVIGNVVRSPSGKFTFRVLTAKDVERERNNAYSYFSK